MIKARVKYDVVERKNLRRIASVKTETLDLHEAKIVAENEAPFALEFTFQNKGEKLRAWQGKLYRCAARNLDLSTGIIEVRTVFRDRLAAVSMTWLEPDTIIINDRAWVPASLPFISVSVRTSPGIRGTPRVILQTAYAYNAGSHGLFSLRDYDAALACAEHTATHRGLQLEVADPPKLLRPELVPHDERIRDRAEHHLGALTSLAAMRQLLDDATAALLRPEPDALAAQDLTKEMIHKANLAGHFLGALNPSVS